MSKGKVKLGENAKVNIKWNVNPIDYSHDSEANIVSMFAKKYGISKDNVKVTPQFVTKTISGEIIPYSNDITENIQDSKFQQQLFKAYLDEKAVTDYNFDQIIEIDELINSNINYELYEQHKHYAIKWIKWDNFMSYGPNNFFDFTDLKGLVLLTSDPSNQGGKTTFCLDLIRFLLFGKVTSRESDWTLSKIFNKHLPEATECVVEGCISIDGNDYVIRRTVSRPALAKRTDKSKVSQKINYYKLVNDEYIDLENEDCEEEATGRETNKAIKDAIGNEADFDLMICVDSDNLKGLISLKDTDRGRLIARWIGLLPLEEKDKIARETFNKTIMPSLLLNKYNKEDLKVENERLNEINDQTVKEVTTLTEKRTESERKLKEYQQTKETLLSSKREIDESLTKVDIKTIEATIETITQEGKAKRSEKGLREKELSEIGEVSFNKETYDSLVTTREDLTIKVTECRGNYKQVSNEIDGLRKGEYCPTCGAKLANVDNSKLICEKINALDVLVTEGISLKKKLDETIAEIAKMDTDREKYNKKLQLEILISKIEVDIENLLARHKENKRILDDISANKAAIENNNKIDTSLNTLKVNIDTEQKYNDDLKSQIEANNAAIKLNNKTIDDNKKIIEKIEEEEKTVKSWKLYLDLIGKNGISKLVLRTVLPLINGELKHLLSDVCDFDVEVAIDNHNDVAFYLIHDGVKSNLSSGSGFEQTVASLALRSVLSKISTFSKPSFVVFDEILGGVAEENYDSVKKLYDKIVSQQGVILQICHLKSIADWHNKTITVTKKNNISSIKTC